MNKSKKTKITIDPYYFLHDGAFAGGGNIMDFIKENPDIIGGVANTLGTIGGGVIENVTGGEDNRSNVTGNAALAGGLKGAGQGAQMGSVFGPLGTGIGAGVGAITGAITAGVNAKNNAEDFAESKLPLYRANGGSLNPNEIESIEGPSHENGGVALGNKAEVEGGEARVGDEILSDRLINPLTGNTFAKDAKRIESKYIRVNDGPTKLAKEAEIKELIKLNNLERTRVESLTQELQSDYLAYGGCIKRGNGGKVEIDPTMRKIVGEAAKARGLNVMEYASNLLALGGPVTPPTSTPNAAQTAQWLQQDFSNTGANIDTKGAQLITDPAELQAYYSEYGGANKGSRIWKTASGGYVTGGTSTVTPSTPSTPELPPIGQYTSANTGQPVNTPNVDNQGNTLQVNRQYSQALEEAANSPEVVAKRTAIDSERSNNMQLLQSMSEEQKADMRSKGMTPAKYLGITPSTPEMANGGPLLSGLDPEYVNSLFDYGNTTPSQEPEFTNINPSPYVGEAPLDFTGVFDTPDTVTEGVHPDAFNFYDDTPEDTTKKFGAEEVGLLASNLPAMDNFMKSLSPEQTTYQRQTPDLVDLSGARTALERDAAMASNLQSANVRGNATSSGQALSALSSGNAAINQNKMDATLQSFLQEETANTNIINQTNATNNQITNSEIDVNAQNKAMAEGLGNLALSDVGNNIQGYTRDKKLSKADFEKNTKLMQVMNEIAPNYKWDDDNGELVLRFKQALAE